MVFGGKNNDQVKIYLSSEAEVNKLYNNHPQVVIKGVVLTVRKLINTGHKIFLCNTVPGMPDTLLLRELTKYTRVLSDMKFVSLGSRNARFGHLISFRRTVLVDNVEDLPASFNLYYENAVHKIFISIDHAKCFKCQGEGHLIKNCPGNTSVQDRLNSQSGGSTADQSTQNSNFSFLPVFASRTPTTLVPGLPDLSVPPPGFISPLPPPTTSVTSPVPPTTSEIVSDDVPKDVIDDNTIPPNSDTTLPTNTSQETKDSPTATKRPHSPQISPVHDNDKKPCVDDSNDLDVISPIILQFDPNIDALVFIDLLRDLKASRKKLELLSDYEYEPQRVIDILDHVLSDQSLQTKIKNRLKNLRKAIRKLITPDEFDYSGVGSQTEF
ncbi:hypothetical protein WDU94_005495 [Cyamophila willieti]